jgi:hypothetical protein
VTDRFPRCQNCGRLVFRTADGYCSERCAALAAAGYRSPFIPAAALRAPSHALDARLVVAGGERVLPEGADDLGEIGPPGSGRRLVRVEADDWDGLAAAIAELPATEILTLQQLVPGGLAGHADGRTQ